tara:strand:- start:1316 stop:1930 length:615 start_codon:yes stop_codon:yes gene_type:complete
MSKKFLHVGCGRLTKLHSTPEFKSNNWDEVRVDIDESVNPDIVASMTDMSVIESDNYDAIYSSHNIEHLFSHEVPIALREFHRVLNNDGFLIITCPDLQTVCREVANGKLTEPLYKSGLGPISAIDILYGLRSDIKNGNKFMAHNCGFTGPVLQATLIGCGFKSVVCVAKGDHYALWSIAFKNKDVDQDYCLNELKKHVKLSLS